MTTNEVILRVGEEWRHYQKPEQVISAHQLNEIHPSLGEIEKHVEQNGWHAAGFISYEAAPAFDPSMRTHPATDLPLLWFGLYRDYKIIESTKNWPGFKNNQQYSGYTLKKWRSSVTRAEYWRAIAQVKAAIARGETYQVNYTFRLRNQFAGSPLALFVEMVSAQPVAYAAYIDTGRFVLCSVSPELFFEQHGATVTCRPMKGTVHRGRTLDEDKAQAAWLAASEKNRAENVMIVDMIRNDLGRLAQTGSVRVPLLFHTERYRTLWQMTSTVQAEIQAPFAELLRAIFPCASITGAPKISTMRIIHALESTPRGVYTGAIGFLAPKQQAQFNVAIRTVTIDKTSGRAEYGVGGGIVWDSTSASEYDEALLKARVLTQKHSAFDLFETLRWMPGADWFLREKHIRRLLDSAEYFGIKADKATLEAYLDKLANSFSGPQRVRIVLTQNGTLDHQAADLSENPAALLQISLAPTPIDNKNIYLYHKTTHRSFYHTPLPGFDDVLHYNQVGELTEFSIGNLVAELDGQLITPPVESGLLPGTFRAHLLETDQIRERILHQEDLPRCTKLYRINAVRGWQECQLPSSTTQIYPDTVSD